MKTLNYKHTKLACYFTYPAMASAFSLPPLLFATFREMYGISYTLLGSLVVICFVTQLGIDLMFSFFTKYFNVHKALRLMPLFASAGLCVYALVPMLFPQFAYAGLAAGTFIFSIAAGLGEVLVSPTVAALPSDTPDSDMSALHSLYGYGVLGVVLISTLVLKIAGHHNWTYLTLGWAVLPIFSSIFFMLTPLPDMNTDNVTNNQTGSKHRTKSLMLCLACIVLGACAEVTISSWISVYLENALQLPKVVGDILGMCLFAGLLALTRSAYAKYGRNILKVLTVSMLLSLILYLTVAISSNTVICLAACAALGICTAMLWPGTLILMEEKVPGVGVTAYALMAAGGDLGASLAPQLVGIVVDNVSVTKWAESLGNYFALSPEQIGFKMGMIAAAIFPLIGVLLLLYMKNYFKKNSI